jgi:hypothetical protein
VNWPALMSRLREDIDRSLAMAAMALVVANH